MNLRSPDHPARYYAENTSQPAAPRPALASQIEAEICVVGAGFAGLTTALGLARAGRPVVVVEANCVGWGASGRNGGCITDNRRAGDFYRVVDGDALLWGGRITTKRSLPGDLANKMKSDIAGVYPQLGAVKIDSAWSGLMGYALHKMPLIGALEPGLWAATAFGGHGLNTASMAGNLIADAISGGDDRWRLFAPFRARWGGAAIGRAGTQAAYWAMQAKDWIEERAGEK